MALETSEKVGSKVKRLRLKELWALKETYNHHKRNATRRNTPFLLTFIEWLTIWRESGHLPERGRYKGQYCMARFGDKGAYEVGNVRIITTEENNKEQWGNPNTRDSIIEKLRELNTGKKMSLESIEKMCEAQQSRFKNQPMSSETKERMSISQQRRQRENPPSPETREKSRKASLGRRHTPKSREQMRQAHLGKPLSPGHRENIRKSKLGKPLSAEHKAKISESRKEYYRKRKEESLTNHNEDLERLRARLPASSGSKNGGEG